MKVPEQIKSAAKSLIDLYGDAFDYLGKYKGKDAFLFRFPEAKEYEKSFMVRASLTSTFSKTAKPPK